VFFFNCIYSRNFIPLALRSVCLKELSKGRYCQNLLNGSIKSEFWVNWESALISDFSVTRVWENLDYYIYLVQWSPRMLLYYSSDVLTYKACYYRFKNTNRILLGNKYSCKIKLLLIEYCNAPKRLEMDGLGYSCLCCTRLIIYDMLSLLLGQMGHS